MKGSLLIGLVFMAVFLVQRAGRAETIPYADFVNVTDMALDALDEVEALLSRYGVKKRDAEHVLVNLDSAIKRYDRHMSARWNLEEQQRKIIEKLLEAKAGFSLYVADGKNADKTYGERSAKEARELFRVYKKTAEPKEVELTPRK